MADEKFAMHDLNALGTRFNMLWPITDEQCWYCIEEDLNLHFPKVLDFVPKERRRVCVQAGGNCGLYPLAFSLLFQRVFTFEPDPLNFHCLTANCHSPTIHKFNAALSEKTGFSTLQINRVNGGMHTIVDDQTGGIKIFTLPLDSFRLEDVDFLQLDTEGHELFALRGAWETIQRCRPVLCLEITQRRGEVERLIDELHYKHVHGFNADNVYVPR